MGLLKSPRRPLESYRRTAFDFQEEHGLTGISRDYKIPGYSNPLELDRKLFNEINLGSKDVLLSLPGGLFVHSIVARKTERFLRNTLDDVIQANPELEKVSFDKKDIRKVYAFLRGVATGFNPDDIDHYFNGTVVYNKVKGLERDAWPKWDVSPKTLREIERQMKEKAAGPAVSQDVSPDPSPKILEKDIRKSRSDSR